jgi:putative ABC transport system ATP-binding protein
MSIVRVEKVKKSYLLGQTMVHALRGIDFTLKKGDFHGLLGASGSGKSTLLNLIATLDTPDEGNIFFSDLNIGQLNENAKSDLRNQRLAMIFQNFNLISVLNVYENIELPLVLRKDIDKSERDRRVRAAAADVGLADFLDHKPDQLSGGQRQRVAIARALVPQPDLILADEPTANLDSKTAHQVIDLLLELNQKRHVTFLFATHDDKLISRVRTKSMIEDGVVKNA